MSIFLDTSYLIAVHYPRDEKYQQAKELQLKIKENQFGRCYISDYVFDEFITFLKNKGFSQKSVEDFGNALVEEETIERLHITEELFQQAWTMCKKYERLSFTDCTTVVLAKAIGIKKIATFDIGFASVVSLEKV